MVGGGEDRDDARARPATCVRHLGELLGLVAEHDHVRALGELGVRRDRLAAQLLAPAPRALPASTSATSAGSPIPRASAEAMLPAPMRPSLIAARLYRRGREALRARTD